MQRTGKLQRQASADAYRSKEVIGKRSSGISLLALTRMYVRQIIFQDLRLRFYKAILNLYSTAVRTGIDGSPLFLYRRRAIGVERAHRLQSPGLPLHALFFAPHHRLPVRIEDQIATGANFKAIPPGLVEVKKECLTDCVLM